MFYAKRWRRLETVLSEIDGRLDQLERHQDHIKTILMVQNPGSQGTADAYDGLRKQLGFAVSERFAHLTQLVQLDASLAGHPSPDVLAKLVDGWFEQSSLVRVDDPAHTEADLLYDVVEQTGDHAVVTTPAYLDSVS